MEALPRVQQCLAALQSFRGIQEFTVPNAEFLLGFLRREDCPASGQQTAQMACQGRTSILNHVRLSACCANTWGGKHPLACAPTRGGQIPVKSRVYKFLSWNPHAEDDLGAVRAHLLHRLRDGGEPLRLASTLPRRRFLAGPGADIAIHERLEPLDHALVVGKAAAKEMHVERVRRVAGGITIAAVMVSPPSRR